MNRPCTVSQSNMFLIQVSALGNLWLRMIEASWSIIQARRELIAPTSVPLEQMSDNLFSEDAVVSYACTADSFACESKWSTYCSTPFTSKTESIDSTVLVLVNLSNCWLPLAPVSCRIRPNPSCGLLLTKDSTSVA